MLIFWWFKKIEDLFNLKESNWTSIYFGSEGINIYLFLLCFKCCSVAIAMFLRRCSCNLNFKLGDLFYACSLCNVIGSTTRSSSFFTLLSATYVIPKLFSDSPRSTHAFFSVKPWLLWIVNAHASFSGTCCLSHFPDRLWEFTVTGQTGTHLCTVEDSEGPQ